MTLFFQQYVSIKSSLMVKFIFIIIQISNPPFYLKKKEVTLCWTFELMMTLKSLMPYFFNYMITTNNFTVFCYLFI